MTEPRFCDVCGEPEETHLIAYGELAYENADGSPDRCGEPATVKELLVRLREARAELAAAQTTIIELRAHVRETGELAEKMSDKAIAAERGHWCRSGVDTAFAPPFGTIRVCRGCGCLVAGGPTACVRCAEAKP